MLDAMLERDLIYFGSLPSEVWTDADDRAIARMEFRHSLQHDPEWRAYFDALGDHLLLEDARRRRHPRASR